MGRTELDKRTEVGWEKLGGREKFRVAGVRYEVRNTGEQAEAGL